MKTVDELYADYISVKKDIVETIIQLLDGKEVDFDETGEGFKDEANNYIDGVIKDGVTFDGDTYPLMELGVEDGIYIINLLT